MGTSSPERTEMRPSLAAALLLVMSSTFGAAGVDLELLSDGASGSVGEDFGYSVAAVDLDGDGRDEIVVGAPRADTLGADAGAVYIFRGSASLVSGDLDPARAGGVLEGTWPGARFGHALDGVGDVNGDGFDDLLVGAPGFLDDRGAAYLFYGGRVPSGDASTANATLLGARPGCRLGASVSSAGDVNGDGRPDFAVGVPGDSWAGTAEVRHGRGTAATCLHAFLPELPADKPSPVDFTSGLQCTGNTFYLSGEDDGWDWAAGVHGGTDPNVAFFIPDGASQASLRVRVGGGSNGGGTANNNVPASGGFGVEFAVTDDMFLSVQNGAQAVLQFDWELFDEAGLESWEGEVGWLKACFSNSSGRYYLGSNQDGDNNPANDDQAGSTTDGTNEVAYLGNADGTSRRRTGVFTADVTRFVTAAEDCYLDLGVKLGDWSAANEHLSAFFDNITLMVTPFAAADAVLQSPGAPGFGTALSEAGDVNGDGMGDLLVSGTDDRAFLYHGSPRLAIDFGVKWKGAFPSAVNASGDTTGEALSRIQADDGAFFRLDQGEVMYFDGLDTSGLSGVVHTAVLYCSFQTQASWSGNRAVRYALPPGALANTDVVPWATTTEAWAGGFELARAGVKNVTDLSGLQLQYENNDGGWWADWIQFDVLYVWTGASAFPNVTISGNPGSRFGASLAPLGDLDGDGHDDFAIGAPGERSDRGSAFVFLGASKLKPSLESTDAQAEHAGTKAGDRFGASLASGAVSLDGLADLVVGAPGAPALHVFNGTPLPQDKAASEADATAAGAGTSEEFAWGLCAGDVNGLGNAEVVAGAPRRNRAGAVRVFGNADERIQGLPLSVSYSPASDPTINETENQSFGFTVNNPTRELVAQAQWYLDDALVPGETGRSYSYISNYTSAGVHEVSVKVVEGKRSALHSWKLSVVDVNAPPTVSWLPPGDVLMDEGASVALSAIAHDVDGDALTYRWTLDGTGLGTEGPTHVFSPGFDGAGDLSFACTVDDGRGHSLSHEWNVSVRNVNRVPVIDSFDPAVAFVSLSEGEARTFAVTAHDPDGDSLAVMWHVGGKMAAVDEFSFVYGADHRSAGTREVKVVVSDGELSAVRSWSVSVKEVNAPPVVDSWGPLSDVLITEGESLSFWVAAHDPDGDWLNISWLVDSDPVSWGALSFTFSSSRDSKSLYTVQAAISDGVNLVLRNWTLRVNHAPLITTWSPREDLKFLSPGEEQLFLVTPYDPDGDPLVTSWFIDGRYQAGAALNSQRFLAGPSSAGTFRLKAVVSDGRLSDEREWTVQVNASTSLPPVPRIDLKPRGPRVGEEVVFSARESLDDGKIVNYTWDFGDGVLGYGMDVAHSYAEAGSYTVRLTVSDAEGNRASATTALAVSPARAPRAKAGTDWGFPTFIAMAAVLALLVAAGLLQRRALRKLEGP